MNDWKEVDVAIRRHSLLRAEHDYEEGRLLLAAKVTRVFEHLGYASLAEYVDHMLGYDGRTTYEKVRVAEAFESLTLMADALRTGRISWSAAREVTRVATPKVEQEWLEFIRGKTIREIESAVRGHERGDRPSDPVDPSLITRILRLELSQDGFARVTGALDRIRKECDVTFTDEEALLMLVELAGRGDEARSPYQIATTICERCTRTFVEGRGEVVEAPAEVGEMAACDAVILGRTDAATGGEGEIVNTHVGKRRRARQTIPPATRRRVLRRANGKCQVPGCPHRIRLHVHHLNFVSNGGTNSDNNLIVLCSAHHKRLHEGDLLIDGRPSSSLVFRHTDGTPYGRDVLRTPFNGGFDGVYETHAGYAIAAN